MTLDSVMKSLEASGTEQNRKVYPRHGVKGALFGVSYADLNKLRKELGHQHGLALELWQTANHDARVLATLIADPKTVEEGTLKAWADDLDNYVLTDSFSGFVGKTPYAQTLMERWSKAEAEFIGQAGWNLLAHLALKDKALPDSYFEAYLDTIEQGIHNQKNRVRHAMNQALIAIGVRSPALETRAREVAKTIGKVEVDHGETGCKTPDAAAYIRKTLARKGHSLQAT